MTRPAFSTGGPVLLVSKCCMREALALNQGKSTGEIERASSVGRQVELVEVEAPSAPSAILGDGGQIGGPQ